MIARNLIEQIDDLSRREGQLVSDIQQTIPHLSVDDLDALLDAIDSAAADKQCVYGLVLKELQRRGACSP